MNVTKNMDIVNDTSFFLSKFRTELVNFHHSIDTRDRHFRYGNHCHADYEIYFFVSGDGDYIVEGERYKLEPYTLILLRPDEFHYFSMHSFKLYERYSLHFSEKLLDEKYRKKMLEPFTNRALGKDNMFTELNNSPIVECLERIAALEKTPYENKHMYISTLLQQILITILDISLQNKKNNTSISRISPLFTQILQYTNAHITEPLTLKEIADNFLMSKSHLSRTFKTLMGVPFTEYIANKKVSLAQGFFNNGIRAEEVCRLVGFNDYSAFFRAYKKITGYSPREWKKQKHTD